MESKQGVKPCPFCGCKEVDTLKPPPCYPNEARCTGCGAAVDAFKWNDRPTEDDFKEKWLHVEAVMLAFKRALLRIRGDGPLLAEMECIDDSEELASQYVEAQRIADKALRERIDWDKPAALLSVSEGEK